jgi:hypothetical protein
LNSRAAHNATFDLHERDTDCDGTQIARLQVSFQPTQLVFSIVFNKKNKRRLAGPRLRRAPCGGRDDVLAPASG